MEYILKDYEPAALFHFFEEISAVPRGSFNEKGIADYLENFAKVRGLRYYRDENHNIVIYKNASKGYENKETIMLQGHTDMVCEKNSDVVHDFEKDGIKLIEKDGFLTADGTTLGADNGVAVAMMLTILDDDTVAHPNLECFFTVQEETGLGGAESFDYSHLSAKRIINLDSEDEGIAVASCAGSMNLSYVLEKNEVPFENAPVKISITGLAGGHSGSDINIGRRNSILLLGRILSALYEKTPFNLVSINGGNKRNAIPREATAVISVLDKEAAIAEIKEIGKTIYPVLSKEDKGLKIHADKCARPETMLTYKDTTRVLSLLSLVPNGMIGMSMAKEGLVETSSNLGVAETKEKEIEFSVYARSSVESEMDTVYVRMKRLAKLLDMDLRFLDRCPGWAFNPDSKLQGDFVKVFKETFPDGMEPTVVAIHAGLECGIILERMGGGDAISMGPNVKNVHTPSEILDLKSFARTYKLLLNILKM